MRACTPRRTSGRSPPTGGCLSFIPPWAPGRSGSPGTCPIRATGDGSRDGTATRRPSTPCGRTSRFGAGACTTPPPRHRPWSTSSSAHTPASSRPPENVGKATATKTALAFEDLPYAPDPLEGSLAGGRAGQPARRRRPARPWRGSLRRPRPRPHRPGLPDRRHRGRHQRTGPRPPPATVRIWAAGRARRGHRPRHRQRPRRPPGRPGPGAKQHPGLGDLGLGLWVMHQLDIDVTLRHTGDGFTVRLRHPQAYPGRPPPQGDPDGPLCPPGL